jgi:hypothetical protein
MRTSHGFGFSGNILHIHYTVSFIATTATCTRGYTQWRYAPQDPRLREIHSATMATSYLETRRELSVTPAGHQKSAGQPDVTST